MDSIGFVIVIILNLIAGAAGAHVAMGGPGSGDPATDPPLTSPGPSTGDFSVEPPLGSSPRPK